MAEMARNQNNNQCGGKDEIRKPAAGEGIGIVHVGREAAEQAFGPAPTEGSEALEEGAKAAR
jgi:hypothetical protein